MIWLLPLLLSTASAKGMLNKITSCKSVAKDAPYVMVVKQWHLPPQTVTKGFKERYPHEKNQSAIYISLLDKMKSKKLDLVVAEGCEGEINDQFTTVFNGWGMGDLKKIAQTKNFTKTLAPIPMKLEARFGDKLETFCGDNEKLIQEGNLRLSNMRGWAGYYGRLSEKDEPDKKKPFAESAAALLKESKDSTPEQLLPKIREKLKSELEAFQKSLTDRNEVFVKTLQAHPFKNAAVVIGGLHTSDLKDKIEAAGFGCDIWEPTGYAREDEQLIAEFQKALNAP